MIIQLNTDKNINGSSKLESYIYSIIGEGLTRFKEHITRIEVHLSDENGPKKGINDKRCVLEVRLENKQPIAFISRGNTIEKAITDALHNLKSSMDRQLASEWKSSMP